MRTTITLDPDTDALIRRRMRERGVTFKQAVNEAIHDGLAESHNGRQAFQTETAAMGIPAVNLDRALQLASELEDEEIIRKLRLGK